MLSIYYQTKAQFTGINRSSVMSREEALDDVRIADAVDNTKYKFVQSLSYTAKEDGLNKAFDFMQDFNWSPNGEARELISSLGLEHTSMMVGDVVQTDKDYWIVMPMGWRQLEA